MMKLLLAVKSRMPYWPPPESCMLPGKWVLINAVLAG